MVSQVQKEIVDELPLFPHGLLILSPRIGKTKIGIDLIKKDKPRKILWITPSSELRDVDIPREFQKWRAKTYLNKTTIVCWKSLHRVKGHFDLIIMDEYQDITLKNTKGILDGTISYNNILGLSGTHPKHEEKNKILDKLGLKMLKEIDIDEAVSKGLIAPYHITVVECSLERELKTVKAGSKYNPFLTTELAQYEYMTRSIGKKIANFEIVPKFYYLNRMRFIYNLKSKNNYAKRIITRLGGRTLAFTGSKKMAENLCKNTYHSGTTKDAYNSFQEGRLDQLACVNSGGVGNTYRKVDNFLIVQVNSNKKGDATQKIARSLVLQEGYKANIILLVVKGTVDESWKDQVLEDFSLDNVTHVKYEDFVKSI